MDETCELERRLISEAPTLEINRDDNGRTVIRGYAAVYESDSKNLGGFVERLSKGSFVERLSEGCFDDVLASNPDVFARFNHSDDMILGRTTAGTLRLFADEKGLRYEIDPPRSAAGLVETRRKRFGTMPSCFLTASSKGCEAAGAASMVAGIGRRDIHYLLGLPGRIGLLPGYLVPSGSDN